MTSNILSNVNISVSMDDPLWTTGSSVECAAAFMDRYLPARVYGRGGGEAGDRVGLSFRRVAHPGHSSLRLTLSL